MLDQADQLRRKMKRTRVISVISGKGGVGKSNVSLNFAIALRRLGKNVILIDLDIGMANLDILMGVIPARSIVDMLEQRLAISDIVERGTGGIPFIAGGTGLAEVVRLDERKRSHFLQQLQALEQQFDVIVFDMGAGVSEDLLNFILASDEIFLVTTPEPTAVTDAYAALKFVVRRSQSAIPIRMIVNRCHDAAEGRETAMRLQKVSEQFLNQPISSFHSLPDDRTVSDAVKARVPVLLYGPRADISKAITNLAERWCGLPVESGGFLRKLTGFLRRGKEKAL
ncbi:MAG TPA: MinD/ParA family protein [Bacillales bacterium]|nr:MinD/ParA family protein [Bacillales bacterium]